MRAYTKDYAGWAEDTARAIAEGRWAEIDREALADEVQSLGISNRREIESALRVILIHLLKTKYQPLKHTRSWDLSILEQRRRLQKFFKESPSLLAQRTELTEDAYGDARIRAARQTGLELHVFPEICPWSFAEVTGEPVQEAL